MREMLTCSPAGAWGCTLGRNLPWSSCTSCCRGQRGGGFQTWRGGQDSGQRCCALLAHLPWRSSGPKSYSLQHPWPAGVKTGDTSPSITTYCSFIHATHTHSFRHHQALRGALGIWKWTWHGCWAWGGWDRAIEPDFKVPSCWRCGDRGFPG